MTEQRPSTIHLKNYKSPSFDIKSIDLTFELDDTCTKVSSRMEISTLMPGASLELNGEELTLISLSIDGKSLEKSDYELTDCLLTIFKTPSKFVLEVCNHIDPLNNTLLDGLYKSGGIFCTQNEPEGFRRITYYIDRPDVLSLFTTKIIADKKKYPILLSNGNKIDSGELSEGRHFVEWNDPFPKPCYLYALVAGDLGMVEGAFQTMTGRKIQLQIFCDKGNESNCSYAMESLQKSMKWDEQRFNLEYDLDLFMIVAVDAFNMGAMENKGLNIFNSALVLANPQMATDDTFARIESVVGHEYFHNWTGNRVTCRDWFQLTLKEGLTVYRDQEFSSDLNNRTVQRIQDVKALRASQFVEDQGPTSHPIKPDSYIEINNFYTSTIYEKGSEVIRMIATLIGEKKFKQGIAEYFRRYDGQAVTTEDFIDAMSCVSGRDFTQFRSWYSQAGTPEVFAEGDYNEQTQVYTLSLSQKTPGTAGEKEKEKKNLHIPLSIGLIGAKKELHEELLELLSSEQKFIFKNISERPVLSLNRNFSAPVKVYFDYSFDELCTLWALDSDGFNRFEASQVLFTKVIKMAQKDLDSGQKPKLPSRFLESFRQVLSTSQEEPALAALFLIAPELGVLLQDQKIWSVSSTLAAKKWVRRFLAKENKDLLTKLFHELSEGEKEYDLDPLSVGRRSLKSVVLNYLMALEDETIHAQCYEMMKDASNMTDELCALKELMSYETKYSKKANLEFFEKWKHETLVMQKWFQVQGTSGQDDVFEKVEELESHQLFDKGIPNFVRALVGSFVRVHEQFHHESGRGYKYLKEKILFYDEMNPQVAAGLAGTFRCYRQLPQEAQNKMEVELSELVKARLSKNTYEIISKIYHS